MTIQQGWSVAAMTNSWEQQQRGSPASGVMNYRAPSLWSAVKREVLSQEGIESVGLSNVAGWVGLHLNLFYLLKIFCIC